MAVRSLIAKSRDRKELPEKKGRPANDFDEALIEEDIQEEDPFQSSSSGTQTKKGTAILQGTTQLNFFPSGHSNQVSPKGIMTNPLAFNPSTISQSDDWDKDLRKTNESLYRSKMQKSSTPSIGEIRKVLSREKLTTSQHLGELNHSPNQKEGEPITNKLTNVYSSGELIHDAHSHHSGSIGSKSKSPFFPCYIFSNTSFSPQVRKHYEDH
jgi:hypothetical protein